MLNDSFFSAESEEAPPFRLNHAGWGIASTPECSFERADYGFCTVEYIVSGRGVLESDGLRFDCGQEQHRVDPRRRRASNTRPDGSSPLSECRRGGA